MENAAEPVAQLLHIWFAPQALAVVELAPQPARLLLLDKLGEAVVFVG